MQFCGQDMSHNLFKKFINFEPIKSQKNAFFTSKDSQNHLFRFLLNYMKLLFMPLFNKFHQSFDKYILTNYSEDDAEFYEKILPFVHKFVVPFIEDLPAEFSNLFSELYELIVDRISNKGEKLKPL